MTTRSWESVAKEKAEIARMERAQNEVKGLGFVEVFLPISLIGASALEVYRAPAGGSADELGSMAKPKLDTELVEPYSRWLARVLWRDGKWRVIEGRYENKRGWTHAQDKSGYIVWNPDVYEFKHERTALLFAQKFLDRGGDFTQAKYLSAAFRKAHSVK
jgi:hypothetical protein